jgi:hypothetical protein
VTPVGVFFKYQNGSGTIGAGLGRRMVRRSRRPKKTTIATKANPTATTANHNKKAETNSIRRPGVSGGRLAAGTLSVDTLEAGALTAAPVVGGSAAGARLNPAKSRIKKSPATHRNHGRPRDGSSEGRMNARRDIPELWPRHKPS